jgi:hypothetical protein
MAADDFFDSHQLDLIGAFHLFDVWLNEYNGQEGVDDDPILNPAFFRTIS